MYQPSDDFQQKIIEKFDMEEEEAKIMSSDADTEEDFLEIKDEETGIEPFK